MRRVVDMQRVAPGGGGAAGDLPYAVDCGSTVIAEGDGLPGSAPRSLTRVAEAACGLHVLLTLRPNLVGLVDLLQGAFAQYVATGMRPLACLGRMLARLGISPATRAPTSPTYHP